MDFTNDTGTYIMLMSDDNADECEWLFGPGAEFEIGNIQPTIYARSKEKKIETTGIKDEQKEEYLEKKE